MEAQSEETGTANGNFDDLMGDIKTAIDLEASEAEASSKASKILYERFRLLVLATLMTAVELVIVRAIASSRIIARPIHEVSRVAKLIALR
jgi:hypothetical protein